MKATEKYRIKVIIERVETSVKDKYLVDKSNYEIDGEITGLVGVPCKVISDVYSTGGEERIRVESLITGMVYQTKYQPKYQEYFDDFYSMVEKHGQWWAEHGYVVGECNERQIIGKPYFTNSVSHCRNFEGTPFNPTLYGLEIISLPFEDYTYSPYNHTSQKILFVLVADETGRVGRVPFEEWHLKKKGFKDIFTEDR